MLIITVLLFNSHTLHTCVIFIVKCHILFSNCDLGEFFFFFYSDQCIVFGVRYRSILVEHNRWRN